MLVRDTGKNDEGSMSALLFDARIPERIWDKIIPEPNSGCWIWLGAVTKDKYNGYGKTCFEGDNNVYLHRLMYTQFIGEIHKTKEIDHKCKVKCCCNPNHLEAVFHSTNALRGTAGHSTRDFWEKATVCKKGHPRTPENTKVNSGGWKHCRICYLANKRWTNAGRIGKQEDYER